MPKPMLKNYKRMIVTKQIYDDGINIEHGQNEEQAESRIRSDLISNAVIVTTAINKVRKINRIISKSRIKNNTHAELR